MKSIENIGVENISQFADDLVILAKSKDLNLAQKELNISLTKLSEWTKKVGFRICTQ